jgi:hypothetical protein
VSDKAQSPRRTPYAGRLRPYGPRAITKQPCTRCGAPSAFQWQACANGRRFTPLCPRCDLALNETAVRFMRLANAESLLAEYRRGLEAEFGPLDTSDVV